MLVTLTLHFVDGAMPAFYINQRVSIGDVLYRVTTIDYTGSVVYLTQ